MAQCLLTIDSLFFAVDDLMAKFAVYRGYNGTKKGKVTSLILFFKFSNHVDVCDVGK